jgi:hypothetical protein
MNPRERKLAILLGAFIVLGGGGFFLYQFLYVPWRQQEATKERLEGEIFKKKIDLIALTKELPKLATWRLESLPSDLVLAKREYTLYLDELLTRTHWTVKNFSPGMVEVKPGPTTPDKKAMYTSLIYNIDAQATEAQIVDFLQRFAKTPLMHKVRSLSIEPAKERAVGGAPKGPAAGGADKKGGFGKDKGGFGGFGKDKGGFGGFGKGKKGGDFAGGKGKKGGDFAGGKGGFGGFGGRGSLMNVQLKVEALIVGGPEKHWTSPSGLDDRLVALDALTGMKGLWAAAGGSFLAPMGLAQVPWVASPQGYRPVPVLAQTPEPRSYSQIASAKLFSGQQDLREFGKSKLPDFGEVTQFVHLYLLTWDSQHKRGEGKLYNMLTNATDIRLRDDNTGYKIFQVRDDDGKVILKGEVLKISDRKVYFAANGEIFAMHVGESLAEAMAEALSETEAKELGLVLPKQ